MCSKTHQKQQKSPKSAKKSPKTTKSAKKSSKKSACELVRGKPTNFYEILCKLKVCQSQVSKLTMPPKTEGGYSEKKWAVRRKVKFFSQVNVHTYPKSGCDTLFFGRIRVVIWKNNFVFSNKNSTSRRPAHFLPHVTNIFWDVFGLVRASAFLFFQNVFTHFG